MGRNRCAWQAIEHAWVVWLLPRWHLQRGAINLSCIRDPGHGLCAKSITDAWLPNLAGHMANAFGARVALPLITLVRLDLWHYLPPFPLPPWQLTQQLGDCALLREHMLRQIIATQAKAWEFQQPMLRGQSTEICSRCHRCCRCRGRRSAAHKCQRGSGWCARNCSWSPARAVAVRNKRCNWERERRHEIIKCQLEFKRSCCRHSAHGTQTPRNLYTVEAGANKGEGDKDRGSDWGREWSRSRGRGRHRSARGGTLMIGQISVCFWSKEHVRRRHTGHMRVTRSPSQASSATVAAAAGGSVNVYGHNGVSSGRGVVHYRRRGSVCRESVAAALIWAGIYEIPHVFCGLVGNLLSQPE